MINFSNEMENKGIILVVWHKSLIILKYYMKVILFLFSLILFFIFIDF